MFGKKISEYVRFEWWLLVLIGMVWAARLAMSLHGSPFASTRWISINLTMLIGLVYCAVAVHLSGFGSYKQLLGLYFVQVAVAHVLIAAAIVLGIVTGMDNAFTVPEVFGGSDGKNWLHVIAHLTVAIIISPLMLWLIGSLILAVTRALAPRRAM